MDLYLEICTSISSPPSYKWRVLVERYFMSLNLPSDPEPVTPPDPRDFEECDPGSDYYWCTGCILDPGCYAYDDITDPIRFSENCYSTEGGTCD